MAGSTAGFPTSVGYNANADLAKSSTPLYGDAEINANIGLDLGSRVGVMEESVQVKGLGFGGSIGRTVGISTPIAGVSYKLF